ncbi:hypothetical protein [Streptomyces sp. NPDC005827]|uniref:hypothetical protein n=1 Tax=Streptomyces sp. NPDC005827 TaxID=3157070 RepID=UPI00340617DC
MTANPDHRPTDPNESAEVVRDADLAVQDAAAAVELAANSTAVQGTPHHQVTHITIAVGRYGSTLRSLDCIYLLFAQGSFTGTSHL